MPMMLVVPEPPVVEEPIAGQLRSLIARGYLGLSALETDVRRATCEELKVRGGSTGSTPRSVIRSATTGG